MTELDRRDALLTLAAAAATLMWSPRAHAAPAPAEPPARVRAGARVTLTCPGATAFKVAFGAFGVAVIEAPEGTATFRVPVPDEDEAGADEWTSLCCTPTRGGHPIGAPRRVEVLTVPVSFGA